MKNIYTLGLMSGTSVDSIDASLLFTQKNEDHLLLHHQIPYPKILREEILSLIQSQSIDLNRLTRLHYSIGDAFAKVAETTIKHAIQKKLLKKGQLFSIGAHGQTVFHDPEGKRTLQLGEGSLIAAKTGVTTVSDLRTADTALGGEGAPLLPFYHRRLFQKEAKKGILVHNLGGISNFTYIGAKEIFALDTGPANCLLDGAMQKFSAGEYAYDDEGQLARSGRLSPELLEWLKNKPEILSFRKKRAPKSTGRELFSPNFLADGLKEFSHLAPEDILHTLTEYSVDFIVDAFKKNVGKRPVSKIVFAGGGVKNSYLVERIEKNLPKNISYFSMEDFGWNSQALESQAFAYFSYMAIKGFPITFPSTTGTSEPAICGKISPGKNWEMCRRG